MRVDCAELADPMLVDFESALISEFVDFESAFELLSEECELDRESLPAGGAREED